MRYFYPFLVLFINCSGSAYDQININDVEISETTINEISNSFNESYQLFIRYRRVYDSSSLIPRIDTIRNGLYFERTSEQKALSIHEKYKYRIREEGNFIFLSNPSFGSDGNLIYDLAIIKANDQFETIKLLNTNGQREGISNSTIYKTLQKIHQKNTMEIYGVDQNYLKIRFSDPISTADLSELGKISPNMDYNGKEVNLIWYKY